MKRFLSMLVAALAFIVAPFVQAGPPNPKHIPADAKWYVHLDMESLRATDLFLLLKNEAEVQGPLDQSLKDIKDAIGVNPLTDISGVTLFNTSFEENVAAALVYVKADQQALTKILETNPTHATEKYNDRTLHTWTDQGKGGAAMFYGDELVILGDKGATVKAAVDVLDGKKAAGPAIVKQPAAGTFCVAGATGLKELANRPNSQMLAQAESLQMSAGEANGKLSLNVDLKTDTPETANKLKLVTDGLRALVALNAKQTPEAAKLVTMVKINVDANRITATFEQESKEFLKSLKAMADQAAKPAQ